MLNLIKKKIVSQIIKYQVDKPINQKKTKKKFVSKTKFLLNRFGNKNPKKIFYVIKVDKNGGGGLFSNVLFVLNHLKICERHNFIPVVDMENFPTRYNEKNKINNSYNSWEYYFEKVSKFSLNEVYSSNNVILTDGFINDEMAINYKTDKDIYKLFNKYIKIKKKFLISSKKFSKKYFKNKKVLAVHFRGTSMKTIPKHPLPPTPMQIINLVDEAIDKYKFDKIFFVTDQLKYLDLFKKIYGEKLCYRNSFRSNKSKIFDLNVRKNHRYNMGVDALEDTLLISKLRYLICSRSNMSEVASIMINKKMKVIEIWNGYNPNKILFSQFNWKLRENLPEALGGFKKKINLKFSKRK